MSAITAEIEPTAAQVAEPETKQQTIEIIDGVPYDAETGECLGLPTWRCESEDHAKWVSKKLLQIHLQRKAAEEELATEKANLEAKIRNLTRRGESFHDYFAPIVGQWAEHNLEGSARSIPLAPAKLEFRKYAGGVDIRDEKRETVAFVKAEFPHAVAPKVTDEVKKSLFTAEDLAAIAKKIAEGDITYKTVFKVKPADENKFTIRTGHEPKK